MESWELGDPIGGSGAAGGEPEQRRNGEERRRRDGHGGQSEAVAPEAKKRAHQQK